MAVIYKKRTNCSIHAEIQVKEFLILLLLIPCNISRTVIILK